MGRLGKIVAAKVAAEVIDEIGDARRHQKHHSSMSHGRPMQNNMHQRGHAKPMQNNMHPQNQGLGRRAVRAKIIKEILD